MIASKVSGIPCLIDVTHFNKVCGSFSREAASDMDYHGWTDIEFTVCDKRGKPAPWLERKMTDEEYQDICDQIEASITARGVK